MTPKDFHTLIEKALVTPKERAEAWRLYKEVNPDAGIAFMQNIECYLTKLRSELKLKDTPVPYKIWGREHIEQSAIDQMMNSARLPVSVAGALMPDAHQGYGLPIGGVLATDNAVIPYAVGVDIACRMMLTVYPADPIILRNVKSSEYSLLETSLLENTIFGSRSEGIHDGKIDHPILDKSNWQTTPLIKSLHLTATRQIGTSGTGNHFVEWGEVAIKDANNPLHLKPGSYLALLSHSGSRGVGFKIADYYTKLAMAQMPNLDDAVKHLAWLDLARDAGQEYWDAMELAGKFASANHHIIHQRVAKAAGLTPIATVENHHNFAWRETIQVNGKAKDVIVHRKGATPAGQGVLGIIPGTMADTGYIVSGKGSAESLHSASHGGGRLMSRRNAIKTISSRDQTAYLAKRGVKLHGGGLDEAPQAYKQIEKVIAAQSDLVDIIGEFQPRIVRMASDTTNSKPVPAGIIDAEGD